MSGSNGFISGSRTASYSPSSVTAFSYGSFDLDGWFTRADVDLMDHDPRIRIGFRILCAPVEAATHEIKCDNTDCADFIRRTLKHFWTHDLHKAMGMAKYGSMGGELVYRYDDDTQLWEYDTLKDFHLNDVKPLDLNGNLWGVNVYSVADAKNNGQRGRVTLQYPSSFWVANEAKFSSYYGRSRYEGAWKPWREKRGKHGAVQVRQNWMIKNSMRGAMLRYPEGTTETAPGVFTPNQDVAREILEKYMAGFVLALPGERDDKGNYKWEWIEAKAGDDVQSILKYSPMLDQEMLEGMEIWPEVLQAGGVGGGWSGRAIPFLMFLSSEDRFVQSITSAFNRQCIRPLVHHNFGARQRYSLEAVSLLPKDATAMQANANGAQGLVQQPESLAQPMDAGLLGEQTEPGMQLAMIGEDGQIVYRPAVRRKSVADVVSEAITRFLKKVA